jgi:hypothetical protein
MYCDRGYDFRRQKCGQEGEREGSKTCKPYNNKAGKWSIKKKEILVIIVQLESSQGHPENI